jgi:hypothetical protein
MTMPSDFVPFLKIGGNSGASGAGNPPDSAANSASDNAAAAAGFAALVPGQASPNSTPASGSTTHVHAKSKPVVTLKRNGDQVTHIHIQCACGEVVELECAY